MKHLFLTSYFSNTTNIFLDYIKDNNFKVKKVTFIPTASKFEEVDFFIKEAIDFFKSIDIEIDILELSTSSFEDIKNKLENNDFIYIGGGNTFFLLKELKRTGADKILIEQINLGKLYVGESAGSIVLSSSIDYIHYMDSNEEVKLKNFDSLNIVDFYPVPHYQNFPFEESTKMIIEKYHKSINLLPFNNNEVIIVNDSNYKVIKKT
ncbi:Type 1 glutamine amidotransferase-like domain-containing protein [Arcobacter sp. YIC-310]|uniref:Type 1 glutamine amidotransferase-like domain-containing protein n=1 Tax=Arcobacter sp. YIC-310 TaxID=3376632 RepID=UPI003C2647C9